MKTKSGRSSRVSNRSTSSSRLSRPGSAVDLLLEWDGCYTGQHRRRPIRHQELYRGNAGKHGCHPCRPTGKHRCCTGKHRCCTGKHRCLEASPVPKFVAGLDLNPSLSNEMTAAPIHSSISLEAKQGNPEVSTAPVVLRRSERMVNKPKVDYRQVAF